MNTKNKKPYFAEMEINICGYETYSSYIIYAESMEDAEEQFHDGNDDDNEERITELRSLVELPESDYKVLTRYI